jgi:hypothetical protein
VKALIALVQALGPWPAAFLMVAALLLICGTIALILLRSNIALDIDKSAKGKWRVRFVRLERGGRISDLPLFSEARSAAPKSKRKPPDKLTK